MRLVIGGPTRDTVPASFAVDLAELYVHTLAVEDIWLRFVQATYVHVGREMVLEAAIRECDATHVLWLDTDMTFPPDTAIRLAAHKVPLVACNYVTRDGSGRFTAVRDGVRIETRPDSTGLEAVDGVGFGVVLMQTSIVKGLARPWFRHGQNAHAGDIGEDLMFCRAARTAGHSVYLDHDLSKEVGHVGQHTYRLPAAVALSV